MLTHHHTKHTRVEHTHPADVHAKHTGYLRRPSVIRRPTSTAFSRVRDHRKAIRARRRLASGAEVPFGRDLVTLAQLPFEVTAFGRHKTRQNQLPTPVQQFARFVGGLRDPRTGHRDHGSGVHESAQDPMEGNDRPRRHLDAGGVCHIGVDVACRALCGVDDGLACGATGLFCEVACLAPVEHVGGRGGRRMGQRKKEEKRRTDKMSQP